MRCFNRRAVSGFVVQMAESAFSTSPASMALTGRSPNTGKTSASREASHCALCLAFRNVALCAACTCFAASLNVGTVATLATPFRQGIAAGSRHASQAGRLIARVGERHELHGAEAEIAALAGDDGAQDPPLRAGGIDDQVQAVAIGVAAGRFRVPNAHGVQPVVRVASTGLPGSGSSVRIPHDAPHSRQDVVGRQWTTLERDSH